MAYNYNSFIDKFNINYTQLYYKENQNLRKMIKQLEHQYQEEKGSPISRIFQQKSAKMWKSITNKIQVQEGVRLQEVYYNFAADHNFRAYGKASSIYPSLNETFLIHFPGDYSKGSKLVHYTSTGTILKFLYYKNSELEVKMVSDHLALIFVRDLTRKREHRVQQWELEEYKRIGIEYKQNFQGGDIRMEVFMDSGVFCVSQFLNSRREARTCLALSYYQLPLKSATDAPLAVQVQKFKKQKDDETIKMLKLNQHSMLGFFQQEYLSQKSTRFRTYELQDGKIVGKIHKFSNSFHKHESICSVKLQQLWEIQSGIFYLGLKTRIELDKINYQEQFEKYDEYQASKIEKYYGFIWDYKRNYYREARFEMDMDSQLQNLESLQPKSRVVPKEFSLEQRHIIQNFNIHPPIVYQTLSLNYIDLKNEKILSKITPIEKTHTQNYNEAIQKCYPSYLPAYQVLFNVSTKGNINIWIRRTKWLKFGRSEISVGLMLGIMGQDRGQRSQEEVVEEWDQDLLYYMCGLLDQNDKKQRFVQYQEKQSLGQYLF